MTKTLRTLLVLTAALYFILASVTYHPDTKLNLAYPSFGGGVWNIYNYLEGRKLDVPPLHYPPFHYFLLKLELPLARLLGGKGFDEWLLSDSTRAVSTPMIFQYNLASKFPLLVLAILSGLLIYKLVLRERNQETKALLAAAIWFFNPVTIYSVVLMGQNDVLAIFIFLIGMWFYPKKPLVAFLLFGLSGSVKSYPLIWAGVMAVLYPTRSIVKKLLLGGFSGLVYLATLAPFLSSLYFREQVLNSGLVTRFFASGIDVGFGNSVLVVPLLLTVVLVTALVAESGAGLFVSSMFILTTNFVVLGFSHFNPQWVLWLMPFWAMVVPFIEDDNVSKVVNRFLWVLTLASFSLIILLFQDKFLTWGILSPLNPNLLNLTTIRDFLSLRLINVNLYDNVTHSIFAGIGLALVILLPRILSLKKEGSAGISQGVVKLFSRDYSIPFKTTLSVIIPLILFSVLFIGAKSLPAVALDETGTPKNILFLPSKEISSFSEPIEIANDSIYRIEVLLKNPNLESRDVFGLDIQDESGKTLASQIVSGFNVGDPSYFRLDFPTVSDSAGKTFVVTVTMDKSKVVDGKLAIGFNQEQHRKLITRQYSKQINFNLSVSQGMGELKRVFLSQPIVLLTPMVVLLFL